CYYLFNSKLDDKYLYYALKSQQNRLMKIRSGACMPNIKKSDLGDFKFTYETNELEQKEIVKRLDKVNDLIEIRKQQLSKLDELVKSRFIEMFGDPVINPKGWQKKKLSDECDIVTGNTPSRKVPEYYGDYIEWIKSDNINTPSAILTQATEFLSQIGLKVGRYVNTGAILMTCIAGSIGCIGNVAIADRKVAFNQQINAIIPNANNTWFMYVLFELTKKNTQSSINMALKGILSKGQLSEMEFIFPPIELQNEFATFVEQTDKLKFEVKQSLEQLETLKKSLMQQYFG
ncbi:MAG: restriction endonuclease subunit S, partial [Acutalibacteraceae bacterium]|nr:restriction endonuclease subunit S [Acutalibacteraceae bacterium]